MSDFYGYDTDDDVGSRRLATKGKDSSRYGAWEQSGLERHIFSWPLKDVLDRNLLKNKVCCLMFLGCPVRLLSIFKSN